MGNTLTSFLYHDTGTLMSFIIDTPVTGDPNPFRTFSLSSPFAETVFVSRLFKKDFYA